MQSRDKMRNLRLRVKKPMFSLVSTYSFIYLLIHLFIYSFILQVSHSVNTDLFGACYMSETL